MNCNEPANPLVDLTLGPNSPSQSMEDLRERKQHGPNSDEAVLPATGLPKKTVDQEEAMEVVMATQMENLNVTPVASHLPVGTHEKPEKDKIEEDSSSEDFSSDSASSSSPCPVMRHGVGVEEDDDDDEGFLQDKRPAPLKTQDEVLPEELPVVEEVFVILPESAELRAVGTISSIIQQLVIVESLKDQPPLIDESILFNIDRHAVGKVFEVFGPVSHPFYVLRFNSEEQIKQKDIRLGQTLFYTPAVKDYTGYIFTEQLKQLKGSDASWKNDQEPPPEALDFSDDEHEQQARRKKKLNLKKKKKDSNLPSVDVSSTSQVTHHNPQQRENRDLQFHHNVSSFQQRVPPRYSHMHPQNTRCLPRPHCLPSPCNFPPPPFPPHSFPFYPPPPYPHPLAQTWPPHPYHSLPFSHIPPPPPPPPQQ